jgi:hypothetical protein
LLFSSKARKEEKKMKMPHHVSGMTVLCLVAFVFVCSTSALFAAPASDQKLVADVQRDLLEGGPLAPLAPRHRPTAASAADLDAIVHEFASVPSPPPPTFILIFIYI